MHYAHQLRLAWAARTSSRGRSPGASLDHALDLAAMAYVNDPRGMRIEDGKLHVSSIYVWFVDDFGGDDAGVIRHLMAYAEPGWRCSCKSWTISPAIATTGGQRRWPGRPLTAKFLAPRAEPRLKPPGQRRSSFKPRGPRLAEKRPRCAAPP